MRPTRLLVGAAALLLSACGGAADAGGSSPAADPTPSAPEETAGSEAAAPVRITGTLGGDAQLEGGCAWIDDGSTRWQVEYPGGWRLRLRPLTLTGPDGAVARTGDTVTVGGQEAPDVMTTCQVGPVFRATSVTLPDG